MTGSARVIRGDARRLPLADGSVDLVVTSPPYFGLRSYQDGGEHYAGQIGDEATPAEFVAALLEVTAECARVLKPSGSMFVNLGDKYSSGGRGTYDLDPGRREVAARRPKDGAQPKTLLLIPERYRIACVDQLGLIARAVIVWDKPNGLPESVTDRVRRSHEDWVHLTKMPRYHSAVDEIREEHTMRPQRRLTAWLDDVERPPGTRTMQGLKGERDAAGVDGHPLGKLPGSVWEIPTQPLKIPDRISHAVCCHGRKRKDCQDGIDHFAAFPMEWPRRIIQGWCPREVCTACGEGRRPIATQVDTGYAAARAAVQAAGIDAKQAGRGHKQGRGAATAGAASLIGNGVVKPDYRITGYTCACPDITTPATPGVVLDPFGGTGTTALVAKALGRNGVSVDMSADYCRLAEWRTNDPGELARALQVDKPPVELDGQLGMFEDAG